ncbi:MAG: hypothetical protein APF80_06685 [Alphaproteobacteria bacterium BRH_c36]|nr:MAG: hypothetical protein APF80_06685 [Alphaproteobacteria bacterium BRH_c36]
MQEERQRQSHPLANAPPTVQPAPYAPLTNWSPLATIAAAAAILAISLLTAYAGVGVYDWLVGLGTARAYLAGEFERLVAIRTAVHQTAIDVTIIVLTFMAAGFFGSRPLDTLALRPPQAGVGAYWTSLLTVCAAAALWFGVLLSVYPQEVIRDVAPYRELMARELNWLMPPIYCLLAPVAEELLFRGFLFSALMKSRAGFYGAAIITSAFWAGLHFERSPLGIVQLFAFGMLLSWLLVKTGSLRIPILCHVLFNVGLSIIVIAWQLL